MIASALAPSTIGLPGPRDRTPSAVPAPYPVRREEAYAGVAGASSKPIKLEATSRQHALHVLGSDLRVVHQHLDREAVDHARRASCRLVGILAVGELAGGAALAHDVGDRLAPAAVEHLPFLGERGVAQGPDQISIHSAHSSRRSKSGSSPGTDRSIRRQSWSRAESSRRRSRDCAR